MSQITAVLDKVYESLTARSRNNESRSGVAPSMEVVNDTVNVYMSNDDTQPADAAAMTLDTASPLGVDIHLLNAECRWILFEAATGTPVVKTTNIIKGVA